MAKEPAKKASTNPAALRTELERTDRELLKLLNARTATALKLIQALGPGALEPAAGEMQPVLERAVEHNKGPLTNDTVRHVFRELLGGTRALQRHERVAFLGPDYSYSHLAALERFGASIAQVPLGSIAAVFEEVNRGQVEFGVVPIENSTDGRVVDTLDMFTRLRVRICGEVQLRIHHALLGRCPRSDVVEVYSKPQALSQCRNWLAKHLPNARTVEVTSTSIAAELAHDKEGAAAIASLQAGMHYGLDALAQSIEDNQTNLTRFAVIGHESAPRSGRDQMALMFEIEHKPGGLADALAIFKRNRLNLTWIESFPIARPEGGYMFFVELDGHENDSRVTKALAALERRAVRLEILGSFPRSLPVD
ncbi:MAG TPA: prephenate dehydratase [Pirellulales bacterium]|jgi:chorismate mutase/prephenate dehydratase|nr:prephenate dehydratase [Pirellulales bacterium]